MTIGASIFIVAIGAILTFAVTTDAEGISLDTVGWILMILGAAGLLLTLIFSNTRQWLGGRGEDRSRTGDPS